MTVLTRARARWGGVLILVAVGLGLLAVVVIRPGAGGSRAGGPAPTRAAIADGNARILNVVAHHDDDLLFLSPALIDRIRQGAFVRTLFFVASDYAGYPDYMKGRELGVREAYAAAAGLSADAWKSQPYSAGGVQATLWTLGERISLLETRVPDGFQHTPAGARRLWPLYADGGQVTTRPGDTFPPQTLGRDAIVDFLRGVAAEYRPALVNTLDPYADLHGPGGRDAFHQDHIAVSRLVMYALGQGPGAVRDIAYHRDYTVGFEPANLSEEQARTKKTYFDIYTRRDIDAQHNKSYPGWLQRSYPVDASWRGDLVVPLPPPRAGEQGGPGPFVGLRYRIVHRQSGVPLTAAALERAPAPAGLAAGQDTGAPPVRLGAVRYGWSVIVPSVSGERCLLPANEVALAPCADDPAQAVRVQGAPGTGYRLVAADGRALTVDRGVVVTVPAANGAGQEWDLVASP